MYAWLLTVQHFSTPLIISTDAVVHFVTCINLLVLRAVYQLCSYTTILLSCTVQLFDTAVLCCTIFFHKSAFSTKMRFIYISKTFKLV